MLNKYFKLIIPVLCCCTLMVQAQSDSITFRITGKDGKPVQGASVMAVSDPLNKTFPDENGAFRLDKSMEGQYIRIETADYKRKVIQADPSVPVIEMDEENLILNNAFEISSTREESASSVSVITSEEIMKSSAINPLNALYGKGLGLTVLQNGGTVWENFPTVAIRGLSTLYNSGVLFIVDGFERDPSFLVKEEIENIQLFKDAAALALYGLKGANGVLYVTTKTGKYNSLEINVNYEHSFNSLGRMPDFVDGYTYASAMNEAKMNDGMNPLWDALPYDQAYLDGIRNNNPFYGNVQWGDELLRKSGSTDQASVIIRGGGKESRFFTVLDYVHNQGFIKPKNIVDSYSSQQTYSKLNLRTNIDFKLTPTTEGAFKLLGVLSEHNRPYPLSSRLMELIYNTPTGAFPAKTPYGDWGATTIWEVNPLAEVVAKGYARSLARTLFADMTLKQNLNMVFPGLSADLRIAYDNFAEFWDNYETNYATAIPTSLHPASKEDYTMKGETSSYRFGRDLGVQWRRFNVYGKLNYVLLRNEHKLNAALALGMEDNTYTGQHHTFHRITLAGNVHYGYKNRYFADFAISHDGSNQLRPGHHFGTFPAVSAAWLVSNEDFMKAVPYFDLLKIRTSWGMVGSDASPEALLWQQKYGWVNGYPLGNNYGGTSGIGEGRYPSRNYTYQRGKIGNIGLDLGLLKMIDFTFEAFHEKRTHIPVVPQDKSEVWGVRVPYENIGKVENKGIELGANLYKEINDLSFNIGGKYTFTRNKILEMGEEYMPYEWMKKTGNAIGQIYGYEAIGYFKDQADIDASPKQNFSQIRPGDIKFRDLNGDGIIDELDMKAIGNPTFPEIYFSVNFGVEYKGFGIDALIQGTGNYSTLLATSSLYRPLADYNSISQHYYDNRWTPDNPDARYPRLSLGTNANNFTDNTVWLADRSYIKLRHAEIYYRLNEKTLAKTPMQKAKVYVRAMDFVLKDHIDVVDPEVVTGYQMPIPTSITIGFSLGF